MSGPATSIDIMTDPLHFQAEWEAVDGSRGDEICATWARFSLSVNGHPVTRVLDSRSGCFRDHVLVPLYPVTEWIVRNWWSLLHELEVTTDSAYASRHDLRFGREGYALPALRISPQGGGQVLLQWRAEDYGSVSFPSSGSAIVPAEAFLQTLERWVEQVVGRLEACNIHNTLLQDEWAAIQHASGDERAFCIAAAQTGLNPYTATVEQAEAIVEAAHRLPEPWHDDFFSALSVLDLRAGADYVLSLRDRLQAVQLDLESLTELRATVRGAAAEAGGSSPWQAGYQAAMALRRMTGIGSEPLRDDDAIANALGMESLPFVLAERAPLNHWFDALAESPAPGRGGLVLATYHEKPRRFTFCRGLLELLIGGNSPSALVTAARTPRQKRNRAFAAELLAPADWLRQKDWGRIIEDESIEEAAEELGVYSEVVRRQLVNHGIVDAAVL